MSSVNDNVPLDMPRSLPASLCTAGLEHALMKENRAGRAPFRGATEKRGEKPFCVKAVFLVCMMMCIQRRHALRARSLVTDRSQLWAGPQRSPRRAV